jgi:insertion element IS1 protein InsB
VVKKANKQWVWWALDRDTQAMVGIYMGERSQKGAQRLWQSLPGLYRQCALCYTDFWESYHALFPTQRHRAIGKETGQTNHVERFNCTLRQRVSRLVRKT